MNKVFIIAEAGVNHNGDMNLARKMIDAAVKSGADAVKFQTFKAETLAGRFAKKAAYQTKATDRNESQFEMLKNLELDQGSHEKLIGYCKKKGIIFLSSPFDLESIDLLNKLGLEIFKIPSGEITNLPYLRKIGGLAKKVILSTGMSDLKEIKQALAVLVKEGTRREAVTVLHCNTEYPTPMEDVNLLAMLSIKKALGFKVGYSDHTLGVEIPIAAAALGASVIEKHFTLDRGMKGPDHKASLEPRELQNMVKSIRNIEKALGSGVKAPSLSEIKNRLIIRKNIVAARNIEKGEMLTEENIIAKRAGSGISPMEWDRVIGNTANRSFKEDEAIRL